MLLFFGCDTLHPSSHLADCGAERLRRSFSIKRNAVSFDPDQKSYGHSDTGFELSWCGSMRASTRGLSTRTG